MKPINQFTPGPFGLEDVFEFGKYRGLTMQYVFDENWRYIEWCDNNISWFGLDEEARRTFDELLNKEDFDIAPEDCE